MNRVVILSNAKDLSIVVPTRFFTTFRMTTRQVLFLYIVRSFLPTHQ